jgi:RimJ/RimL family protein N-acetyltransferase
VPFATLNTDPAAVDQMGEIFAVTTVHDRRLWAVMERIGMKSHDDFDYPAFPGGHRLQRHCLYRLTRAVWQQV